MRVYKGYPLISAKKSSLKIPLAIKLGNIVSTISNSESCILPLSSSIK